MAQPLPPELVRRGFAQELANERRRCLVAAEEVTKLAANARAELDEGKIPVANLRQLVTDAAEAYQRAAAWAALERVAFMLPDSDETKEG